PATGVQSRCQAASWASAAAPVAANSDPASATEPRGGVAAGGGAAVTTRGGAPRSLVHAVQELAALGVHADHVPLVDVHWDLDHEARRERGRLEDVADRVPADAGLGVGDLELDAGGQLDRQRLPLVPRDLDDGVGRDVPHHVAEDVLRQVELLVVL